MQPGALLAALVTALLLAGCAASPGSQPTGTNQPTDKSVPTTHNDPNTCSDGTVHAGPDRCPEPIHQDPDTHGMSIRGTVLDGGLHPIAGANVLLQELNKTQIVSASGSFQFTDLVPSTYFLTASAPEFSAQTLSVDAKTAADPIKFVLEALPTNIAFNETVHFHGHIQCALEALIITPACDTIITVNPINHDPVLNDTFSTLLPVGENWKTVVVDVVFKPGDQPGLDGLRVTTRGTYDAHQLGSYVDYAQSNATKPFTFRIEPDATYTGGDKPVPSNTTQFQFDTYPQSKAWHKACVPGYSCFLGAGAGLDVDFDLYMTTFYAQPAPEGWTLRTS